MTYTIRLRYSDTPKYEILTFIIDEKRSYEITSQLPKNVCSGRGTRTLDLRIMNPTL